MQKVHKVCLLPRGVAEFEGDLPIPQDTVRQMLGPGVRAGLYALSPRTIYWFVTMPGPAVGFASSEQVGVCARSCIPQTAFQTDV